jgi:hypothetical protein
MIGDHLLVVPFLFVLRHSAITHPLSVGMFCAERLVCSPLREPRVQSADKGPHLPVAGVHQEAGDTRRARFVWSRTVDYDVAVQGDIRMQNRCICVDDQRPRYAAGIELASCRRARVKNHWRQGELH